MKFPYDIPDKYAFNDCEINGIKIYAVNAFSNPDLWYSDLIDRAIPAMGKRYMQIFIDCHFHPFKFIESALELERW